MKGSYPGKLYVNSFGTFYSKLFRSFGIVDDGLYSNLAIMQNLLTAASMVEYPEEIVNDEQLMIAIESMERFKDHNRPGETAMAFWPQKYNETSNLWYIYSDNIGSISPYVARATNWIDIFLKITSFQLPDNLLGYLNMTYVVFECVLFNLM